MQLWKDGVSGCQRTNQTKKEKKKKRGGTESAMLQKLWNEVRREGVKVESFGKMEGKVDERFYSPPPPSLFLRGDSEQLRFFIFSEIFQKHHKFLLHSDTEPQP